MSNGKNIRKKLSGKESKTGFSISPQYSAISEHSFLKGTPGDIEAWLMLSQGDSLVSLSRLQENKPEKTMKETCGQPLAMLSKSSDQDTSFWKMSQGLFHVDISETYLKTFPKSGTMLDGKLYQRLKQAPVTKGTGCGLWHTPLASDSGNRVFACNSRGEPKLSAQVKHSEYWPTPTKCGNYNRKGVSTTSGDGLATRVKGSMPTPQSRDFRSGMVNRVLRKGKQADLNDYVKKYPTPTTVSGNNSGRLDEWGGSSNPFRGTEEGKGQLSADWVEWLMNFPVGWSSLAPLKELIWLDPGVDPHPAIPRVTTGQKNRTNRLKALGNGQFPMCAAEAFRILTNSK